MAVTVKMIKVGPRDCILTKEHCVPFDVVAHVEFPPRMDGDPPEQALAAYVKACAIHLGMAGKDPLYLDWEEAKQLKKLLSLL